ncbi:MAG TPA: class I SAM-dependent methyltransferase [Acidobacteriota bacterium]|nr:class I SAM-dependent methyltransferase [Acidobacteriota bacterium]
MAATVTRVNEATGTFSERFPILFDPTGRIAKAEKIIAVLRDYFGDAAADLTVLDIGSSTGIMTRRFADVFGCVIGIDTDRVGVAHGAEWAGADGVEPAHLHFCGGDGCLLPLGDATVDAVICNQVYEHVDDHRALVDEIHRVLRPGGVCYFGIGTRHVLIEGHYKLPFLSWLPHTVADIYMRLAGKRARYDVTLLSYGNLRRLVHQFAVVDYTIEVIKHARRYADGPRGPIRRWVACWPTWLLRAILPLIPVHVWLLVKPGAGQPAVGRVVDRYQQNPSSAAFQPAGQVSRGDER